MRKGPGYERTNRGLSSCYTWSICRAAGGRLIRFVSLTRASRVLRTDIIYHEVHPFWKILAYDVLSDRCTVVEFYEKICTMQRITIIHVNNTSGEEQVSEVKRL